MFMSGKYIVFYCDRLYHKMKVYFYTYSPVLDLSDLSVSGLLVESRVSIKP